MSNSARVHAYEVLRNGIVSGAYSAGTWLREEEVAAGAGVSRTPVREALHRLEAEGFVELVRNRGALVIGWTAEDLDNLYDLRIALEGVGARRAAERRTDDHLQELERLAVEMDQLLSVANDKDLQRLGQLSVEFHTEVHRASKNRQLNALLPTILAPPFVSEAFHHHTRSDLEQSFDHHRELIEAIEARDADWAESLMTSHLRHGRQSLRRMERHLPLIPPTS